MKTHCALIRRFAVGALGLSLSAVLLVGNGSVQAQPAPQTAPTSDKVELLFVQNALSGSFDGTTLTLTGVGPTIFFSDRPYRVAGHVRTAEFIGHWDKGSDNFAENPPNATLSIFGGKDVDSVVVELTGPNLRGSTLSYKVKVLQGKLPTSFKESSLFIDIFGRWRMAAMGMAVGAAAASAHRYYQPPPTAAAVPVYTAPAPPPAVNVTVTPPAGVAGGQAAAVARLKEIKSLLKQGLITQSQYDAESQKLLNEIVE
jgi:hypothetical protein